MSELVPPSLPDQLSGKLITKISLTEFVWSVLPRLHYALTPNQIGLTELHVGPTENPNGH